MSSFLRLLALGVFVAAGIGIAICLAASIPTGDLPTTETALSERDDAPTASNVGKTVPVSVPANAKAPPATVPPHGEYSAQFPSTSSVESPARASVDRLAQNVQVPPIPDLGDIGKAIFKQVLEQQAVQNKLQTQQQTQPAGAAGQNGLFPGPGGPAPAQQQTSAPLPTDFTVTKLPGEGDEHLTVHIQNKQLREVLDFLGEHGNLSILAAPGVQGLVSVSLTDVTIEQAL